MVPQENVHQQSDDCCADFRVLRGWKEVVEVGEASPRRTRSPCKQQNDEFVSDITVSQNFVREHSGANFVVSGGERLGLFRLWCPSFQLESECVFSGMLVECLLEDEEVARPLYRRGPKLADLFVERAVEMGPAQRKRGKVCTAKQSTRVRDWETWRLSLCTSKATMHLGVF